MIIYNNNNKLSFKNKLVKEFSIMIANIIINKFIQYSRLIYIIFFI